MRLFFFGVLLLSVVLSELTCDNDKVYVKFTMQTASFAEEQSFKVLIGNEVVFTSPLLEDNKERQIEHCLPSSTNSQYTLVLMDEYEDSWTSGAYLAVSGIENNIVFKNYMVADVEETFALSLYYAYRKNGTFKMTSSTVSGNWKDYSYDDSLWSEVVLGSDIGSVSGTQFFRKTFTGLANMAAYELSLFYRFGIVVHINGKEVYRDNMPVGDVTSTTAASGQYLSLSAQL